MKVHLLHENTDFDTAASLPPQTDALMQDLDLDILIRAMSDDDKYLAEVAKSVLFQSLLEKDHILYRQEILQDAIDNEGPLRDLYALANEAIEAKRHSWFSMFGAYPSSILYGSVRLLQMYVPILEQLRKWTKQYQQLFRSRGLRRFCLMIQEELNDDYMKNLVLYLKELQFIDGVMISAGLKAGNEPFQYELRKPHRRDPNWIRRLFSPRTPSFTFSLDPRDEAGGRALGELRDRGINYAANAVAQSADHIENFFKILKQELAFYIGALNLKQHLVSLGEPYTFPIVNTDPVPTFECSGLYNICLALVANKAVMGNSVQARGKHLAIITGVNEGGKSTFLRSVGIAQLMMQSGLFVPAQSLIADIRSGVFTHYRRKEDRNLGSGKFDEELKRMNTIVDLMGPNSLILFNESFASTNEREGSEIARYIVSALLEAGTKVFFVTHLYTFAHYFQEQASATTIMLRAERRQDGSRTFRIVMGAPSQHSHGEDLYKQVFTEAL
ncbi:MutS-related protein [Gracilinema caldarium]|uniref:DNA mismatch repair protein MutS domain protein n=1 Tax=Gracilinema caldarium (strain ATCC 51460 / DSM 7334 / H1) TaxID=744872 RepID=F8F3U3_GRAC1|nr:DNA mismatch repair protein MutS [Gracilinema caldarium]AEJ20462.1 DNA mismatch repair protein MutS domain protein [Gracilinema caldarium DSM 7334]